MLKTISDITDSKLKDNEILIVIGTNISDTTCNQMFI